MEDQWKDGQKVHSIEVPGGEKTREIQLPSEQEVLDARYGKDPYGEVVILPRPGDSGTVDRMAIKDIPLFLHTRLADAAQFSGRRLFCDTLGHYTKVFEKAGVDPVVIRVLNDLRQAGEDSNTDDEFQAAVSKTRNFFREIDFVK